MVTVRHIALPLMLTLLALSPSSGRARSSVADRGDGSEPSLFAQSASEALNRDFPSHDISYLLLDARTGRLLASRWDRPEAPIPMGSLLKPFAALAYGEQHDFRYPGHTCRGTATGCWLPGGHGDVNLSTAIAYSCNSYFRMLVADLNASDVSPAAARFGIEPPGDEVAGPELAGLGKRWRTSPLRMARAYLELVHRRRQPGASQVVGGMAQSARQGTGAAMHRALPFADVLVKTGTGMCTHFPHAPGDGFTVALMPADDPRILLMVRVHGVPGAQAARTAAQMLREIGD
jgi:transpeptidase family protein